MYNIVPGLWFEMQPDCFLLNLYHKDPQGLWKVDISISCHASSHLKFSLNDLSIKAKTFVASIPLDQPYLELISPTNKWGFWTMRKISVMTSA